MRLNTTLLACPALVALASSAAAFQTTTSVSVNLTGAQGNGESDVPVITPDGRFVAFSSGASNLVAGDTNGFYDIFVRDLQTGTTELVSVAPGGALADSASHFPSLSADGRFVAFHSVAMNLVPGDTWNSWDVFVHDRLTGTNVNASVDSAGVHANLETGHPSISADGRFVAFFGAASNLVVGDTNGAWDVFVHDMQSGTTERVSIDSTGIEGNSGSGDASISADGRFVAFRSVATNLVAGDTNGTADVFVRDRLSGTTERINVDSAGAQADWGGDHPAISADGRFVSFLSDSTNLVVGDTNARRDVFVRDRTSGTTERVSVTTGGVEANFNSFWAAISADGRYVVFWSGAWNLVAGDTNDSWDVFVHDRSNGTTDRASLNSAGTQGNSHSSLCGISTDGRLVVFRSESRNLVSADPNGTWDIFVRDRGPQTPNVYCTAGTTSNGCNASIAANANPSISSAHSCSLTVMNVEAQKSGIVFYGIDNTGYTPGPWASGSTSTLCVKSPTQRTPIQNSGGTLNACDGSFVLDWNAYQSVSPLALGNPWSVGAKVYAQAWFHDPLAVKSTNLSNALEMTYVP